MSHEEARVHYFQGQFLRPEDFAREQEYHLAAHRRHNVANHRWGIVAGLELVLDPQGAGVLLQPGVAVDAFGRVLVLGQPQPIEPSAFADKGSDSLDVYLTYSRAATEAPPPGYGACGDDGAGAHYRWSERPDLVFEVADDPSADRRDPPGVLDGDRGFDPSRTPPDDPRRRWPVFLGSVVYDRADPKKPFTVDLAGRPYAGLVGGSVIAPSGGAVLQLGAERRGDDNRFAVFVPEADNGPIPGQPRLAVHEDGSIALLGDATLEGNLTVDKHALRFDAGQGVPAGTQPSHLYRTTAGGKDELRVEMAAPGADGPQQVSIGRWLDGAFEPCLTVGNDCTVTVHGDLVVEGTPAPSAFAAGAAPRVVFAGRRRRLPDPALFAIRDEDALLAAATTVAAGAGRLPVFVDELRARHPEVADRLREALEESPE
jgi:hypothetical protein